MKSVIGMIGLSLILVPLAGVQASEDAGRTPEQIHKAVDHPRKAKAAHKIKKHHPDATPKQIRKAVNHPRKAKAAHRRHR